jgi:hypothetical protein
VIATSDQSDLRIPIGYLPLDLLPAASGAEDAKPADSLKVISIRRMVNETATRTDPAIADPLPRSGLPDAANFVAGNWAPARRA